MLLIESEHRLIDRFQIRNIPKKYSIFFSFFFYRFFLMIEKMNSAI